MNWVLLDVVVSVVCVGELHDERVGEPMLETKVVNWLLFGRAHFSSTDTNLFSFLRVVLAARDVLNVCVVGVGRETRLLERHHPGARLDRHGRVSRPSSFMIIAGSRKCQTYHIDRGRVCIALELKHGDVGDATRRIGHLAGHGRRREADGVEK